MWQLVLSAGICQAFFGGVFEQMMNQQNQQQQFQFQQQQQQQQQQQEQINNLVENTYKTLECDRFLCSDTLACVNSPQECPCVFPDSEIKCEFPNGKGYVCISKPTNEDGAGCDYVLNAFA